MGNAIFKMVSMDDEGNQTLVKEINANISYWKLPSRIRLDINDAIRVKFLTEETAFEIFIIPVINLNNPNFPQNLKKYILEHNKIDIVEKPTGKKHLFGS